MTSDEDPTLSQALARSEILSRLSSSGRGRLAGRGVAVALEPHARLFAQGDPGDALYVILSGEIEVSVTTAAGKPVRIASHGPGALIGEIAVLDGGGRSADAVALRRTRLIRLSREAVLDALASEPVALIALLSDMAARLRQANLTLEATVTLDLKGKLARLLLAESQDGARLVQMTQTEMARRLGVSREKLNRRLHAWRATGDVEISRVGVRILRPGRLALTAQGNDDGE